MAAEDRIAEMRLAAGGIERYLDQADELAVEWAKEFKLPIEPTGEEDTGEYAGKVIEELVRQQQAYKDFTTLDKK
jgi:hypothetical protein